MYDDMSQTSRAERTRAGRPDMSLRIVIEGCSYEKGWPSPLWRLVL